MHAIHIIRLLSDSRNTITHLVLNQYGISQHEHYRINVQETTLSKTDLPLLCKITKLIPRLTSKFGPNIKKDCCETGVNFDAHHGCQL